MNYTPQRPAPVPEIDAQKAFDPAKPHLGGYTPGAPHYNMESAIWGYLLNTLEPVTMLDVGCGEGHAMRWWMDHSVLAVGVEGCKLAAEAQVENGVYDHVIWCDYTQDTTVPQGIELVWCCEVVEHVEEQFVDNLLFSLCCGKALAMTHAVPGQPGYHHVNCQPEEYWIEKVTSFRPVWRREPWFKLDREMTEACRDLAQGHGKRILIFTR